MVYPAGVPTRAVSFGQAFSMVGGAELTMRVTIEASRDLVHRPTGSPLIALKTFFLSSVSGNGTITLPITDSDEMGAGDGQPIVLDEGESTHFYSAKIEYLDSDTLKPLAGVKVRTVGVFLLPGGDGSVVDLDDLYAPLMPTIPVTPSLLDQFLDIRDDMLDARNQAQVVRGEVVAARNETYAARDQAVEITGLATVDDAIEFTDAKTSSATGNAAAAIIRAAFVKISLAAKPGITVDPIVPFSTVPYKSGQETALAVTWLVSNSVFTTESAHGLAVGDVVRLRKAVGGIYLNGSAYTVRSVPSPTELTLYAANGSSGGIADVGSDGNGTLFTGVPLKFPSWDKVAGVPNPAMRFTEAVPVKGGTNFPGEDFVKADPNTMSVNPIGTTAPPPSNSDVGIAWNAVVSSRLIDFEFHEGGGLGEVYVDGEFLFRSQGTAGTVTVRFPDTTPRHITYRKQGGVLPGMSVPRKGASVIKPFDDLGDTVALVGDSFTEGIMGDYLKRLVPFRNARRLGTGSTGYRGARTSGSVVISPSWAARPQDFDGYDGGIVALGINDGTPWQNDPVATLADIRAVHGYMVAKWKWGLVVGPFWPTATPPQFMRDLDDAIIASAEEHGLPWVSPIREKWVTSDNASWVTGPDGTHPRVDVELDDANPGSGALYYASRIAAWARPLIPAGASGDRPRVNLPIPASVDPAPLRALVLGGKITPETPLVFEGDSHIGGGNAPDFRVRLGLIHSVKGGDLEGVTQNCIVMNGNSGFMGRDYVNGTGDLPNPFTKATATNGAAFFFDMGTNDGRLGQFGTTKIAMRAGLISLYLDWVDLRRAANPGAVLVLLNSQPFTKAAFVGLDVDAQLFTDAKREAVYAVAAMRPGVLVYDAQARLFGTTSPANNDGPYYADALHLELNGFYLMADDFAAWTNARRPYSKQATNDALLSTPATPWTAYWRAVEDSANFALVGEYTLGGTLHAPYTYSTFIDLNAKAEPGYPKNVVAAQIQPGDILEILGSGVSYQLPAGANAGQQTPSVVRITSINIAGVTDAIAGTLVRIYRQRQSTQDQAFNNILNNSSIRYKRVGRVSAPSGANTYIDIAAISVTSDRETRPASDWVAEMQAGDQVYVEGVAGVAFTVGTNATPSVSGTNIRVLNMTSTDRASWNGKMLVVSGNHTVDILATQKRAPTVGSGMLASVNGGTLTAVLRGHSLFAGQDTSATGTVAAVPGMDVTRNPQRPAVSMASAGAFVVSGTLNVVDQGWSGDTAQSGWTRWATAPVGDVTFLFYETNEAVTGRPVSEYVEWMVRHIENIQSRGAAVILVGGGPTQANSQTRKVQTFTAATRALAARYGCEMVDVGEVLGRLPAGGLVQAAGDYLHFSTEAYAALGHALAAMLGPWGARPPRAAPGVVLYPQQNMGYAPGNFITARTTEDSGGFVARIASGSTYAVPIDVTEPCLPLYDLRSDVDGNGVGAGTVNLGLGVIGNAGHPVSVPVHTNGKPHMVRGIPVLRTGIQTLYITASSGTLEIERLRFASLRSVRAFGAKSIGGAGLRRTYGSRIAGLSVRGAGDWDARFDDEAPVGSVSSASEITFDVELGASGDNAVALAASLSDGDAYQINRGYSFSRQGSSLQVREWNTPDAVVNTTTTSVFASTTDPWRGRIRLSLSTTNVTVFVDDVQVGPAITTKWRHYVPGILAAAAGYVRCSGVTIKMPII